MASGHSPRIPTSAGWSGRAPRSCSSTVTAIDANEALQWGLVNRLVPLGELMSSAVALATQIAQNAPLAVGMAKLIVDQGDGLDKRSQMTLERWAQSQLLATEDVQEAVLAFMEKRPPKFQGK